MWWYLVTLACGLSVYKFIINPWLLIAKLKRLHKERVKLEFFPFIGYFASQRRNYLHPTDFYQADRDIYHTHPDIDVIATHIGSVPFLEFNDPESFKQLTQDHHKYLNVQFFSDNRLMGKGLSFTNGPKWRQLRRLGSSLFNHTELKNRVPAFQQIVRSHVRAINTPQPASLDLCCSISGDIVVQTFFGKEVIYTNGKKLYTEIIEICSDLLLLQRSNLWHLIKWLIVGQKAWSFGLTKQEIILKERIDNLLQFSERIIDERIEEHRKEGYQAKNDFLDVHIQELLKVPSTITKEEITQAFITLFFGGTDSTATLVCTAFYYLAKNPNYQIRLRDEILRVLPDPDSINLNQLSQLPLMTAFIEECLRMKNPIPTFLLRRAQEDHYIGDIKVKKGTSQTSYLGWFVGFNLIRAFSNPKHFDDPQEFKPDRFLHNRQFDFTFVPFSAAGRNCIGQHLALIEAKLVLAEVIRNFGLSHDGADVKWIIRVMYGLLEQSSIKFTPIL